MPRAGTVRPLRPIGPNRGEGAAGTTQAGSESDRAVEWGDAIEGTIAEEYLRSRGITGELPVMLRFLDPVRHPHSGSICPRSWLLSQSLGGRCTPCNARS